MVLAGWDTSALKILASSNDKICEGCCGDFGVPCPIDCGSGAEEITMPLTIVATLGNCVASSSFDGSDPTVFERTITLYQTASCHVYQGEITWSGCNGPLFYENGDGKFNLNLMSIQVALSGFSGLCSTPYTFMATVTGCFRTTLSISGNCYTELGAKGHITYRSKSGISSPSRLDLSGMAATITEDDTNVSGYCYIFNEENALSEFEISLST